MARINLLPWRQAERERKNREFMTIAAGILLLSLLAAFAAWSYFNDTLDSQKKANEKIKAENVKLDAALVQIDSLEKQRNDMLAQMKVIQDLQGRRPVPVRIWDDIARMIPAQLYLTNMKRTDDVITFTGRADNNNVVSEFIRNLDSSQWLENSAVKSINQPKAVAYQPIVDTTAPNPTAPVGHPEDNYVIFVVTTNISKATTPDSSTAGTVVSATSSTTVTKTTTNVATSSVSSTTAPMAQPVASANAPIMTGTASGSTVGSSASAKTNSTAVTPTSAPISNDALKPVTSTSNTHTVGNAPAISVVSGSNSTNKEKN